jgi:glycosyltransferase involved in cell wall biosynthesis
VKVLILHQHFNIPEKGGAIRSYYLAKALVDKGINVAVITGSNASIYKKEIFEGIEVYSLPIAYDNRFGFMARSWAFIKYVQGVLKIAGQFKDFNYCYAISVPLTVGLAAMRIKARYKIPFIFEVGDLWPDAPIQMGFVKSYFFQQALYLLEKKIYQSAQSIIALSPAIQSAIEKKVPGKTIHMIPNMADCEFYKPTTKDDTLIEKYQVRDKFVISYIGAIGVANGLDYILECARAAGKSQPSIHFFICGDGAVLDRLKVNAKQLALHNLTFLDFRNREGVRELMNITDSAFICYKPVPVLETGSPNKYFDGLAAGKLIVINFSGWIKEEIEENNCGVYVNSHEPADFIRKITPYLADTKLLTESQKASRQLAEQKYSRKLLSEKFSDIFN